MEHTLSIQGIMLHYLTHHHNPAPSEETREGLEIIEFNVIDWHHEDHMTKTGMKGFSVTDGGLKHTHPGQKIK